MSTGGSSTRRIAFAIAAQLLACSICLGGGEGRDPPRKQHGLEQVAHDARYLSRNLFKPKKRPKRKLFAVAGSAAFLYLTREEIHDWVQDHRSSGNSRFLRDSRAMGNGKFGASIALISYGASLLTKKPREKETALLILESMSYSAAAAFAGSYILAAERPEEGTSIHFFDTSGHGVSLDVALAASVIPPLRCQYLRVNPDDGRAKRFWKRAATVLLYSGAALTAYQRMDREKHWAPDVFLGFVAGHRIGRTLCEAHDPAISP
jgi:hypothetical protein